MKILSSFRYGYVCGQDNPIGLKIKVFEESGKVYAEFLPMENHQGYKGIVHGGILFSIMDEVMSRAAMIAVNSLTLTVEINIKYRKKAVMGKKILFSAKMLKKSGKIIETEGKAFYENDKIIAEAKGKFFITPAKMKEELACSVEDIADPLLF